MLHRFSRLLKVLSQRQAETAAQQHEGAADAQRVRHVVEENDLLRNVALNLASTALTNRKLNI